MSVFKNIEAEVQAHLSDESLNFAGEISGGIINKAGLFRSQQTTQCYFVKYNPDPVASHLFETERQSLQLLAKTDCVKVPQSYKVFSCKESPGAVHILEYLPGLTTLSDCWPLFGQQIGKLHTCNAQLIEKAQRNAQSVHCHGDWECLTPVEKFGSSWAHFMGMFTPGQCWRNSWQELFLGDIFGPLINGVVEKHRDAALQEKWTWLVLHIHKVFDKITILPSINHGDLCMANFGQTEQGPVLFDPCVWYAHSLFDLTIPHCEQQFDDRFFEEYHRYVPKGPFWDECVLVYKFFYYVVTVYHVDDEKLKVDMHKTADQVKEMLCKQFGAT